MSTYPLWLDLSKVPSTAEKALNSKAIEEIEKRIEEHKQKISELEKELVVRKAYGAPVRKLNEDILPIICRHAAFLDPKIALKMAGVCRFWRRTLINTPNAWSYIDLVKFYKSPQDVLDCYLERSKSALLDISVGTVFGAGEWKEFIRRVEDVQSRVETLHLRSCYNLLRYHQFLPPSKFLCLTSLKLETNPLITFSYTLGSHRHETFPKLRSLHLKYFTVEPLPLFGHLHELHLSDSSIVNFSSFLPLFRDTLVSLAVIDCRFTKIVKGKVEDSTFPDLWDLPVLRRFILGSRKSSTTATPQLYCPRLERLEYDFLEAPRFPNGIPPQIKEIKIHYWGTEAQRETVDVLLLRESLEKVIVTGKLILFLRDLFYRPLMISPTIKIVELDGTYSEMVKMADFEFAIGMLKNPNLTIVLFPHKEGEAQQISYTTTTGPS